MEREVDEMLRRRFEGKVVDVEMCQMNDLDLVWLPTHCLATSDSLAARLLFFG